jgi:hypothetical protein
VSLVFPGIPIPVIEVHMWGKASELIQWERKVKARTGWNVVDRVDASHVLLIRALDEEREEACLMVEDETSERMQ